MTLYDQVISEVKTFLPPGEDADRFVRRQLSHVLTKSESLRIEHIPSLAWWIGVSASIVIPKDRALLLRHRIEDIH